MVIFAIPYSEATFFLMTGIGIYGLLRKRYSLYFIGFLLAAMTRPALSIVGVSIVVLELMLLIAHKDYKVFLKSIGLKTLPLVMGTAIIMIVQRIYGSRSWFSFVKVQTYWDHYLRFPEKISDWSQEGFAIHIGILFAIFIPLLVAISKFFFAQVESSQMKELPPEKYVLWLSVLYVLGACSLVILFQGGNLHGLFRFTLCTPFFAVLVFQSHRLLDGHSLRLRIVSLIIVVIMCLIFFNIADYSKGINFQDTGFFIFIAASILFLLQDRGTKKWKYCVFALLLINSIWNAYLFNMYLSDGWIFA